MDNETIVGKLLDELQYIVNVANSIVLNEEQIERIEKLFYEHNMLNQKEIKKGEWIK